MKKFRITRSRGWNRPRNGFILTLTHFTPNFNFEFSHFYPQSHSQFWSGPIFYPLFYPVLTIFILKSLIFTLNTDCHSFYPQSQFWSLFYPYELYPISPQLRYWLIFTPSLNWPSFILTLYLTPFLLWPIFPATSPRTSSTSFLTFSNLPSSSTLILGFALFYP